jgi:predicted nucleic acid-binding protein
MTSSMARRTEAYVDTSALIAFVDRSDGHHALFRRLFSDPPPMITTTLVVAEGHGWFLKRYDRARGLQFLAMVDDLTPLAILSVGRTEHAGGVRMIRKFSDQDLSLTDGVGLHIMGERRSAGCWSTDFHLGLTGVPLVTNQP